MRSFSLKLATEYRDDLHQIFNQFLLLAFPGRIDNFNLTAVDCGNRFKKLKAKTYEPVLIEDNNFLNPIGLYPANQLLESILLIIDSRTDICDDFKRISLRVQVGSQILYLSFKIILLLAA